VVRRENAAGRLDLQLLNFPTRKLTSRPLKVKLDSLCFTSRSDDNDNNNSVMVFLDCGAVITLEHVIFAVFFYIAFAFIPG